MQLEGGEQIFGWENETMKSFISVLAMSVIVGTAAQGTTVPDEADFVNSWHGVGSDHQNNNEPGDTADDRHNFDDATAGDSDKNPTDKSSQPE
ncbi:hypothetical protein O2N63_05475 [Aliiroseovarius sp. KMU-50]|uniref:Uncharacterized protein n=1 Tax=Aliiroseovarius salicola TaxID=3009082 RepID=A0ABT4VZ44_9RHOB|nr:hypothetical protein [Aliiroseovarius sp. KMU-50]MDA5093536.1 hypothetical protein [Aliiroseovarius sp. KMU-50]